MKRKLKVLDLFSGIGGFSLGLERTGGFETVAFCEIEEFPRKVLAKHWPGVPIYEDVTTADFSTIGPVDLVTGGFPCQDISLAGKGSGLTGGRSGLYWQVLRAVRVVGQPVLLLENVAALLNRGMGAVLGSLAQIGYDAEWHCIQACDVGLPHKRDRVWILAHAEGVRCCGWGGLGPSPSEMEVSRLVQECHRSRTYAERFTASPYGVPGRLGGIACAGNAVVPKIPELFGRAILEAHA